MDLKSDRARQYIQDALGESEAYLEKVGLGGVARPKLKPGVFFDGSVPAQIHKASATSISETMVLMVSHYRYLLVLLRRSEAAKNAAENVLKSVKADIRSKKLGSREAKEDATTLDERFMDANANLIAKNNTYKGITYAIKVCEANIKVLSRIFGITQDTTEIDKRETMVTSPKRKKREWR